MMKFPGRLRLLCTAITLSGFLLSNGATLDACTGIRIKTKDGAIIYGRTMEFATPLLSQILVIPRGHQFQGVAPGNRPGHTWESKYGFVGANGFLIERIVDGINEKGLVAAAFYHPDYAKYQKVNDSDEAKAIAPWEFPTWLLSRFATVKEAKEHLFEIKVASSTIPPLVPAPPPLHYILHDASGDCAVIEFTDGQMKVYDNPLGVITNSPNFDWHITNLRNYVNLSPTNVPPVDLSGEQLEQLGQGSGLLGLPGDYTPPSRFIRAVTFSQSAEPVPNAEAGINLAAHILNTFDIFVGAVRENRSTEKNGKESLIESVKARLKPSMDRTQWTIYTDITNRRLYFKTYDNQRIREVDLSKFDFGSGKVLFIPMHEKASFEDVTGKAKPAL